MLTDVLKHNGREGVTAAFQTLGYTYEKEGLPASKDMWVCEARTLDFFPEAAGWAHGFRIRVTKTRKAARGRRFAVGYHDEEHILIDGDVVYCSVELASLVLAVTKAEGAIGFLSLVPAEAP